MPPTVRVYWGPMRGGALVDSDHARSFGDAMVSVADIAPGCPPADPNPEVRFVVEVDWEDALPVRTDIARLDDVLVQFVHRGNASDR